MIEIQSKSVTYSVKIDDENFWHRFSGSYRDKIERTGDSWYHLEMSRYSFEGHGKESFSEEDRAALLALETDYYHFHWYDPKPDARRKKTFEKRFKKSLEGFHGY